MSLPVITGRLAPSPHARGVLSRDLLGAEAGVGDLGLAGGDLRAAERSFQQIQQVAGRAGRGDKPGRVFVQSHDPDAPVIAALVSGDAPGFYAAETEARREAAMPPFGRLAAIVVSAEDASEAEAVARRIGRGLRQVVFRVAQLRLQPRDRRIDAVHLRREGEAREAYARGMAVWEARTAGNPAAWERSDVMRWRRAAEEALGD